MNIEELHIGDNSGILNFRTSTQHREATIRLVEQAKRSLRIHSYDLDPQIYNNRRLIAALRGFIAANRRNNRVEILIHDTKNLVSKGHQLVDFAQQFSSFVTIKKISQDNAKMSQGYIIVDETSVVRQSELRRFDGIANFNDRSLCKKLLSEFSYAWSHADTATELRRLYI